MNQVILYGFRTPLRQVLIVFLTSLIIGMTFHPEFEIGIFLGGLGDLIEDPMGLHQKIRASGFERHGGDVFPGHHLFDLADLGLSLLHLLVGLGLGGGFLGRFFLGFRRLLFQSRFLSG